MKGRYYFIIMFHTFLFIVTNLTAQSLVSDVKPQQVTCINEYRIANNGRTENNTIVKTSRSAIGKNYELRFYMKIAAYAPIDSRDNNYYTLKVTFTDGSEVIVSSERFNFVPTSRPLERTFKVYTNGKTLKSFTTISFNKTFDPTKIITQICNVDGWDWWQACPSVSCPGDFSYSTALYGYNSSLTLSKIPYDITLSTYPTDHILTDLSSVQVKTNFSNDYQAEFDWFYNYKTYGGTWNKLGYSSDSYVYVSTSDLRESDGTNFLNNLKQEAPIVVRASNTCLTGSEKDSYPYGGTITLQLKLEAPPIKKYEIDSLSPKCPKGNDGSVTIPFSRKLHSGEAVQVILNNLDKPLAAKPQKTIQNQEDFVTFTGLQAGHYEVTLANGYILNNNNKRITTYTNNTYSHVARFSISDPVSMSLSDLGKTEVHCRGGSDGTIYLTPSGGTGDIRAWYSPTLSYPVTRGVKSDIPGVAPGDYTIELADANGCRMANTAWRVSITQPATSVSIQQLSKTDPKGYGLSDGAIEVIANGGTGGFIYSWEKNSQVISGNGSKQNGLDDGRYKISVRDDNYNKVSLATAANLAGCQNAVDIELHQPDPLVVAIHKTRDISCNGFFDGVLEATVGGGVGGYRYEWYKSIAGSWVKLRYSTSEASDLDAGIYQVSVFDNNGIQTTSAVYTLAQPDPIRIAFKITDPSCFGDNNGRVEANVTGGNGGYVYTWLGHPVAGPVVSGGAQNYAIKIIDSKGCREENNVTMEQPAQLAATFQLGLPSAASASDGSITILPQGGTPGYTYLWDYRGATTNPLTGIPADSTPYRVVVKDAHNCQVDVEARMIYPLGVRIAVRKPISCKGDTDGLLEAMPEGGGSRAYTYQWYKKGEDGMVEMACDQSVTGELGEGVYQVKIEDSEHNQAISPEFTFRQPDSLGLDFRHMDPLCKDGSDGWLEALAGGGTQPYHYVWEDRTGWDAQKLDGLTCGTYAVEITDSHGCRISGRDSLAEPDSLLVTHEVRFPSVYGGADGVIRLFPVGGTAPYRYRWAYGNADTNPLTGLPASDTPYEVTVTDRHGCYVIDTPRMYNPLIAEIRVRDSISCYGRTDGRLAVVLAGGVGAPYSFRWFKENEAGRFIPVGTNDSILPQVADGVYQVEVRDCTDSLAVAQPFVFRQPDTLQLHFAQKYPECKHDRNGWTQAIVAGGTTPYRYVWTDQQIDGTVLRENLPDGSYEVVVTDRRGCLISGIDTLIEPDSLIVKHKVTLPSVFGGADGVLLLEPEGGTSPYRYAWDYRNSTDNPLTGLSALKAPLRAVVTDAHGCQATDFAYMYNPVTIELEESGVIICSGQTNVELTAHVKGGAGRPYRFEWYFVEDDLLTRFEATDSLLKPIGVGTYRVVAYDSVGNMGQSADYTIYSPDSLRMEFEIGDLPCKYDQKGWIQAIPLGGEAPYRLEWFNGSAATRVENLEEGRYEVKLTDKRGCFITRKVKINSPDELLLSIDSRQPLGWHGRDGAIWVTPVGGTRPWHYQWQGYNNDRDTLDGIPAGTYTVTVTDRQQCSKTISGIVTEPPLLEVRISCTRIISCYSLSDGVLLATATGGVGSYRYDWYRVGSRNDQWVASGEACPDIPAGRYQVRVTDGNGIVAWAEAYTLGQPELLKVRTEVSGLLCDGDTNGKMMAIAEGGTLPYQYLWTTGDEASEISGLAAGRYLVMVKDAHGCLAEALGTVVSPAALAVTANVTDPVCFGGTGNVVLTATGGTGKYQILWADGNTKPKRDDLKAGHYPVQLTDANGCLWKEVLDLYEPEQLVVDLGKERTFCRDQESELIPLNVQKVARYKWFKDGEEFDSKSSVTVREAGLYRLEIQTRQGCLGHGEVKINQNDAVIDANFAMASEVEAGDLLKVVNTCLPMPSYCEWIIPQVDGLEIVSNDKDLAELLFARTGEYTIGLRSVEEECEATLYKSVTVISEGTEQPLTRAAELIIGDIQAWPNPNDGHFRVRISLNRKASGLMRLYALTGALLREQKCEGAERYELAFDESLPAGIYIIHVIFGNEREAVKIMVE